MRIFAEKQQVLGRLCFYDIFAQRSSGVLGGLFLYDELPEGLTCGALTRGALKGRSERGLKGGAREAEGGQVRELGVDLRGG